MTPMQQWLREKLSILLNCATDEEYREKKGVLIAELRREHPQGFTLDADTKRVFEQQAQEEGMTLDEKLEELALIDYVSHQRVALLRAAPPPDEKAAAGLAALGLSAGDLNQLPRHLMRKILLLNCGPNEITGANAGGPRQLPIRTRWTARVAQFWR